MKKLLIIFFCLVFIGANAQNRIAGYEYWFNQGFGARVRTTIAHTAQAAISLDAPTTGLPSGIHLVNIRGFDTRGLFSPTLSQFFYKAPPVAAGAAHQMAGYEYWFNNGFAARTRSTVAPGAQAAISLDAPTTGLPTGLHLINIRGFDTRGLFSPTLSQFFYKAPPVVAGAANQMAGYEYWFNNEFANRTRSTVAPGAQAAISLDAPTTGLPSGIHLVNIRGFDTRGLFSPTLSQFFYKAPPVAAGAVHQMAGYEYWFNNGFAARTRSSVAPGAQTTISLDAPTTGLPSGIHLVNIRGFDTRGLFSPTLSQFFYKAPPAPVGQNRQITAYQYWLGNDYSNAVTVNVSPQQQLLLADAINTQGLATGLHLFNIRFLDNTDLWSATTSQFFFKHQVQEVHGDNLITGYRYWFNNDPTTAVSVELKNPVQNLLLVEGLDMTRIPKGTYSIHFRFRDSRGLWSLVTHDVFIKNPLPIADFRHEIIQHCDSTVVSFTDRSVDGDRFLWNFGDGRTSALRNPRPTFHTAGTYRVSLTVTDTIILRDSTLIREIVVPVRKVDTGIREEGIVLTANALNATFQWVDCNNNYRPIPGQTGRSFTATVNGRFAVEVTQGGCVALSACYAIITVDVPEIDFAEKIRLFPNPNTGQFTIDLGEDKREVWITVFDQHGRKVEETYSDYGREFNLNLDLKPGIYFARIIANGKLETIRFVVR